MMRQNARLFIARHGEKALQAHPTNPPLTEYGLSQASSIKEWILHQMTFDHPSRPSNWKLLCSPLKRAQQTLQPLASHLEISIQTVPELAERDAFESAQQVRERCRSVLLQLDRIWEQDPLCAVVIVSHYDFLSEFIDKLSCNLPSSLSSGLRQGQCIEFEAVDSIFNYKNSN